MVGFVPAKNGIPKITGEGNWSNTTHECACMPCTIALSKATIYKHTSTCLLLCNTYLSASKTARLQPYIPIRVPCSCNSCTYSHEMKLCSALESNKAEIGPIELATKWSSKSKKRGLCLFGHIGQGFSGWRVARAKLLCSSICMCSITHGWLLHRGSSCMRSAICSWLLCDSDWTNNVMRKVGHAVTLCLLHIRCSSCCDGSTTQIPEAKSRGLVDLFLLFSFHKWEPKKFFVLFGLC